MQDVSDSKAQPCDFVENACVHGIERKPSPGWVFVRVYEKQGQVCLEVEDTGIGMPEKF